MDMSSGERGDLPSSKEPDQVKPDAEVTNPDQTQKIALSAGNRSIALVSLVEETHLRLYEVEQINTDASPEGNGKGEERNGRLPSPGATGTCVQVPVALSDSDRAQVPYLPGKAAVFITAQGSSSQVALGAAQGMESEGF